MGPGSTGQGVAWVRARLSGWDSGLNNRSGIYDADLGQRLKRFQRANFLVPDGVVGEKTMVMLNRFSPELKGPQLMESLPKLAKKEGSLSSGYRKIP